ncbi:MAG: rhamnogalacturonan acetylesterase [Armatimonadota bacterium]|nr:rhamnogalacturonan acetylesterase [Armatimonadota bacterium]
MKTYLAFLLAFLSLAFLSLIPLRATADAPPSERPLPTLYIIGDSTVKNGTKGLQGWGDPIATEFDSAKIHVENRARGGRSSRTYLTEGLWEQVRVRLKPGDFVLMQFGHNDGGSPASSYRASLKGNGDETQNVLDSKTGKTETVHTYGWYLRQYISRAKAGGATAIVLSPIPRNIWNGGKVARNGNDYGKWASEAAQAGGAAFVDLNAVIADRYDALGQDAVKSFFPGDHTHTNPAGAELNAASVVEGIKRLKDCALCSDLSAKGETAR